MKKFVVVMLMAVTCVIPSNAQVRFGLKGGLNLTSISLSESGMKDAFSNKSGFFIGPTVRFRLPVIGLGMDAAALYDQREAEIKSTGDKVNQKSIQVPVNVRYDIGLSQLASLYFYAGPQFGFNVGKTDNETWLDGNSWLSSNSYSDWSLKKSNVSGNVGLGLMFLNHLQVSVNYNFAITKSGYVTCSDKDTSYIVEESTLKNNAWQIALAYYF